jgi:hypothetical protein
LNLKNLSIAAALLALLLSPLAARSAEDGQLWEVTSQMDMGGDAPPGMSAMMGKRTSKMCRGEDPREAISKDKEMKECEIKDFKQTDTTVSMTAVCKKGRVAKIEVVYNKGRSEYKGTMKVKDGKNGDEMTMRTTGKKLGPCDVKKDRAESAAKVEKYKSQGEEAQAQYKAMLAKAESDQIKGCAKGLDKMNPGEFGVYSSCFNKKDKDCRRMMEDYAKSNPKASTECSEKAAEFCKRFQTPEGFHKVTRNDEAVDLAGKMCDVKPVDLRAKLCKVADKSESLEFIGAHCRELAKPLAKKHCAGRSYTVKEGDPRRVEKKWFKFCVAVAGSNSAGEDTAQAEETPKAAKDEVKSEAKKAAKSAAVDAFKGLFGR